MYGLCGIIGVSDAADLVAAMLNAIQHQGKSSWGIAYLAKRGRSERDRGEGLISNAPKFPETKIALGIVSAKKKVDITNVSRQGFALAVAGHLSVASEWKAKTGVRNQALLWQLQVFKDRPENPGGGLVELLADEPGYYSAAAICSKEMLVFADPTGLGQQICFGQFKTETGEIGVAFSTESCALDFIRVTEVKFLNPGQYLRARLDGSYQIEDFNKSVSAPMTCAHQTVWGLRPDSRIREGSVSDIRLALARSLALKIKASGLAIDTVVGVPDSAAIIAPEIADLLGANLSQAVIRNHYYEKGLAPDLEFKVKLNTAKSQVKDKKVLLVALSIVSGGVLCHISREFRKAGVKEVHVAVVSVFVRHCPAKLAFQSDTEFVHADLDELASSPELLGADSISFLNPVEIASTLRAGYCMHCLGVNSYLF